MLATIPNDTWNVLNMQHIIQFMDQNKQHLIELPEAMMQGLQFQTRGGINKGINRYKPSCHKQVSDTQNVINCHKQVLNYKTVWNCVSNILQYIIYVIENAEKNLFSFFISIKSLYCIIINVWAFD